MIKASKIWYLAKVLIFLYHNEIMTFGLLPYTSWSVCTVKSHSILHLSFSITTFGLFLKHFSFTSIPYFLHISQWIFIPNQSCYLLYCLSFQDLLMVSFLLSLLSNQSCCLSCCLSSAFLHILYLQFSWVLSVKLCFNVIGSYSLFPWGYS